MGGVTATRQKARAYGLALLLACACTPCCNRLGAAVNGNKSASDGEVLPFHSEAAKPEVSQKTEHPVPSSAGEDDLPFRAPHSRTLPSGTLVTVRLEHPLDSSSGHAGDTFSAVVAESVAIDGDTLVARGATVTGVIESTQRSLAPRRSGYIRLALNDLMIDGKRLPLQTSSLFEGAPPAPDGTVRLPQGRRLTFRLISATPIDDQSASVHPQDVPGKQ